MTNGDKIRAMTDEELAKLIEPAMNCAYCPAHSEECSHHYEDEEDGEMPPDCSDIILHWLRKEADE